MRFRGRHPTEQALSLFAGGDLSPLRDRLVRRHVARCVDCRATVEEYEEIRGRLARAAQVPAIDFEALSHRIRTSAGLNPPGSGAAAGRDWRLGALTGVAAVAAACAAILLLPEGAGDDHSEPASVTESIAPPPQFPMHVSVDLTQSQITPSGGLSVRSFDSASGTLTITDYYVP